MLREMAAEKVVSNLPIFLGSSGWLACAITAIAQNPARGSRSVGIGVVALWSISGVGSGRNDVLVVDILKHFFRRCDVLKSLPQVNACLASEPDTSGGEIAILTLATSSMRGYCDVDVS